MTNEHKERAGSALIALAFAGLAAAVARTGNAPGLWWAVCAVCCGFSGMIATGTTQDSLSTPESDDEATLDRIEAERLQEAADDRRPFWLSDEGIVIHDGGLNVADGASSDGWLV